MRTKIAVKICQQCSNEYLAKGERKNRISKYCSRQCRDSARRTRVSLACRQCGKVFQRKAYLANRSIERGPFCGFACYGAWQKDNLIGKGRKRVQVECHSCGKTIEKQPNAVAKHNFCSRACYALWRASDAWRGENNPSWRGGHIDYRGENWNQQSSAARKRDNDTCQHCGKTGTSLPVHHIIPFHLSDDYITANRLSNLNTLCQACHSRADNEFWAKHPDLMSSRRVPFCVPTKTCRNCGKMFEPRSPRTAICDDCCTTICANCEKRFYSRKATHRKIKYCTKSCRNAAVRRSVHICKGCGNQYLPKRAGTRYCSRECHLINNNPRRMSLSTT